MKFKKLLFAGIFVFAVFSVHGQDYVSVLNSRSIYDSLCGEPLSNKYGNVTAVKIVMDLKSDSLYFLGSKQYKNHYEFCHNVLGYMDGAGNFLKKNYSNGPERKYLLSNINYFHASNSYVLDISPVDLMSAGQIVKIYQMVVKSTFIGKNILFLVNSPRLQKMKEQLNGQIPVIEPSEIYQGLTYQAVSKYTNSGKLRMVEDIETLTEPVHPDEIIILKNIPNYLPAVAGVIVTEFQTPLSHISILGLNRKIPICAYSDAFKDENILKNLGKHVEFTVNQDTFFIVPGQSEIKPTNQEAIKLEADLSVDSLIDVGFLTEKSSEYVGSKASNFGVLNIISKTADFKTPEGAFAIPFYFYDQHIKRARAARLIRRLASHPPRKHKALVKLLGKIRHRIEKEPVDSRLIRMVEDKLYSNGEFTKFRFRSSTNAEDIKGFSGAGLYTSKTANVQNPKKSVERAIQLVWASLWSYQGYTEREYFNMDQTRVYMGILVHRSFPDEAVNGVALTKNIYRKNSNGFLINAQLGDHSVVKPEPGATCDQLLCFPSSSNPIYKDKIVVDVLTYSSLNNNQLVMTEQEIQHLANQLAIIKRYFTGPDVNTWVYTRIGYDVEFKLDGKSRQLYIKQVRPYND